MNVELAKTAGFCFGVKRAVDTVYKQIEKHQSEKIFTYGPIIHNEEVIKDLRRQGVEVIGSEEELDELEETGYDKYLPEGSDSESALA